VQPFLGVRGLLHAPGLAERLDEEKPQGPHALVDGVVSQFAVAEQMRHVLANLFGAELVRRTVEMTRKLVDGAEVGARGTLRVITALEYMEAYGSTPGADILPLDDGEPFRLRVCLCGQPVGPMLRGWRRDVLGLKDFLANVKKAQKYLK
jgi:hypothetical protein